MDSFFNSRGLLAESVPLFHPALFSFRGAQRQRLGRGEYRFSASPAVFSYFGEFGRAARKAMNYGGNNFWDGYTNMVDLSDLVRQSELPEYGSRLLEALDDCVY